MNTTRDAALIFAYFALATAMAIACATPPDPVPEPVKFCGCDVLCSGIDGGLGFAEVPEATREQCAAPPPKCFTRPRDCR